MVTCKICNYTTENSLQAHLNSVHKINNKSYSRTYPESPIYSEEYKERHRKAVLNRDDSYKITLSEKQKDKWKDPSYRCSQILKLKQGQNRTEAKINHRIGAEKYFKNRPDEEIKKAKDRAREIWYRPDNIRIKSFRNKSIESRNKLSSSLKRYFSNSDNLEKRKRILKETWAKPENREKLEKIISIGLKTAMSEEGRSNLRKANLRPDVRLKRSLSAKKNIRKTLISRKKYSNLNKFFEKKLLEQKMTFKSEYPIGPYLVDFCFPEKRLVIEVDGDWWHANPEFMKERNISELHHIQKKMVRIDKAKNTYLKNHEWKVLRFWERVIYNKTEECLDKIKGIIYGCSI